MLAHRLRPWATIQTTLVKFDRGHALCLITPDSTTRGSRYYGMSIAKSRVILLRYPSVTITGKTCTKNKWQMRIANTGVLDNSSSCWIWRSADCKSESGWQPFVYYILHLSPVPHVFVCVVRVPGRTTLYWADWLADWQSRHTATVTRITYSNTLSSRQVAD